MLVCVEESGVAGGDHRRRHRRRALFHSCFYPRDAALLWSHVETAPTCAARLLLSDRQFESIDSFFLVRCRCQIRTNMAAPCASRELFTDGVRVVLNSWPVLQIAVDNGFGGVYGQQKADWLVDVVQQYFHDNADLQSFEVEDFVAQLMDQEFDTVVDDGSLPQVSQQLMQMFSKYQQGALQELAQSIQTLRLKNTVRSKVTAPPAESDSDSESDSQMECETPQPSAPPARPQEPDEDGWTVVRKKK
ncbi:pre-rRNA-processing protein TSR2 homolog [Synchiropus splendidus]|uniref:pre-rRNA-processing protein TSR2 homolog n=1 Tax=Synchiropus splendidus TaxID=270530 RepID=UPI00237D36C7|nr:pre-rRNA-processing protein TSR2 homolog [Synchiropus splendidus]